MKPQNVVGVLLGSGLVYLVVACSGGASTSEIGRIFDAGISDVTSETLVDVLTDTMQQASEVNEAKADDSGSLPDSASNPQSSNRSGARLKVRTDIVVSSDGTRYESSPYLYDANQEVKCHPVKMSDGKTHCVPIHDPSNNWKPIGYSDEQCNNVILAGGGDSPKMTSFVDATGKTRGIALGKTLNQFTHQLGLFTLDFHGVCRYDRMIDPYTYADGLIAEYMTMTPEMFVEVQVTSKEW